MKLWEVLKALDENPNKRFECSIIGGFKGYMYTKDNYYRLDIHDDDGLLISQQRGGGAFNDNILIKKDWHEFKQPVTWQKAIEAWANGSPIMCEYKGIKTFFRPRNVSSVCFTAELITHGTWYIED